jgi:diguanylate cyclase (GGDEF)-like protein
MNSNPTEVTVPHILIVDDNPDNLRLLSDMLLQKGYKTRRAISGSLALKALEATEFDLILLDITMPEMDGYEVCQSLKNNPQTFDIPVIFISALNDVLDKVKAFKVGAVDYITKPFQIEEVTARVDNQIRLVNLQKQLRELNQKLLESNEQLQLNQKTISKVQERILHSSLRDPITNLDTRISFMGKLRLALKEMQEKVDFCFALLIIECDQVKLYNNILDVEGEKRCLVAISQRLTESLSSYSMLARLEGTEFGILVREIENVDSAIELVEYLQEQLRIPFLIDQQEVLINPNCGIVLGEKNYQNPEHLLQDAHHALFQAKIRGYGNYQILNQEIRNSTSTYLELKSRLRKALDKQEFVVNYEPIVSLNTGKIKGFGSILYWFNSPETSLIHEDFMSIAEEMGLINSLNDWLIQEVGNQIRKWREIFIWHDSLEIQFEPNFSIKIPLSTPQFFQPNLPEQINNIINQLKIDADNILLEITETALIANPSLATEILNKLQHLPIQLSIDNFGTNYFRLKDQYDFALNNLKINHFLVQEMDKNEKSREIIKGMITTAHYLGMTVTAEGIETQPQLDYLRELGCDFGQGNYLSQTIKPKLESLVIS